MTIQGLPFKDKEELLQHLETEMNIGDKQKRQEIAEIVIDEAEMDEGNPKKLLESIKNGAKSILSGIGLETVSWVETPSQDSMFVMMKDSDNKVKKSSKIYKEPEEDNWETVYGPVMRPNDIDKDGDIAPAHDIRKAAHEFMAEGRVKQFDQDHDLNTGKGTLVESWILKEDKAYQLPDGSSETIEEGSWMVGVKPNKEVKQRIENGEITGWSIFGQADKISLKQDAEFKNFNNASNVKNFKEDTMGQNQDPEQTKQEQETGQDLSLKDVHSAVKGLEASFNEFKESPEPTTVKSVEELKNLKTEEDTALFELGKDFEIETAEKEETMENMSDLMEFLEESLNEQNFSMLMDAVNGDNEEVEEGSDYEEEKTEEEKSAKHKSRQVDTQVDKGQRSKVSFRNRISEA